MREIFLIVFIVLINIVGFKDIPKIKDDIITTQVIQNEDISKSEITDNKISQDTTRNREIYICYNHIRPNTYNNGLTPFEARSIT